MKTQEILTIIAMAALALCLVLAFSKGLTNKANTKSAMTHACSLLVVIAVALLAVTQFLSEKENMEWEIGSVATSSMPNGRGSGGKKMGLGVGDNNCCIGVCNPSTDKCDSPAYCEWVNSEYKCPPGTAQGTICTPLADCSN